MILWLDAQLPPSAAAWITATFGIAAHAVRDLGLRDAKDPPIFQAARAAGAVVRRHFRSLGLMLELVTRARRRPSADVLELPRRRAH